MMITLPKNTFLKTIFIAALVFCITMDTHGQNALNFDGIDDQVLSTASISISGSEERTVEAWIQTTDSGAQHIVGWGILQTGRRFDIRLEDSYLRLEVQNGFIIGLNTELNDGEWHHIAVVMPTGAVTLNDVLMYVDGELEPHTEHIRVIETTSSPLSIGSNNIIADREFHGSIDEVRVWATARTPEEINYYMTNSLCDNTGLAARYSFDEGEADGDNIAITTTLDKISGEESNLQNFDMMGSTSNFVNGIEFQMATGVDVQTSCGPFTWIDGVTYDTSNNTATFVLEGSDASMCDSLLTLNLTVVNADITTTDPIITADFAGADYQWLDCDNNMAEISDANEQSFSPAENGNYAVEVSYQGCTLTSECVTITAVNVEEIDIFENTTIYPNPNFGEVNIKLGSLENVDISIIDITGKSVYDVKNIRVKNYKFNLDVPAGMYLIELKSEGEYRNFRLVVQG